jgi:Mce-associated membrane protein
MRLRLKSDSVDHAQVPSATTGRQRRPSVEHELTDVPGSPIPSDRATADEDDFDEETSPAPLEVSDDLNDTPNDAAASTSPPAVGRRWARVVAYGLLPALTVVLGGGAGCLTWKVESAHFVQLARVESVRAATDGTTALLTYRPDTVDRDLTAARERLTGKFRTSYAVFTHQHVIPDAREKHISSVVTVPAAALVRATIDHAVVMVFVNQTFISDSDPPTSTASDVRVTLERVGRRWLISEFTPI